MPTRRRLLLPSIDDYLGPGATRFFARGYQRATYRISGVEADAADLHGTGARATADIGYPANWSKKHEDGDLRPHLSTIDALVLGVQLAQLHLAHAYRLTVDDQRHMRLRKVVLRAGGAPQEDLRDVPIAARLVSTEISPSSPYRFTSRHDCTVGSLRVRTEIEHDITARATEPRHYASFDDVLGPGARRFYGEGFKDRRHAITNVRVDMDALHALAEVHFPAEEQGRSVGDGLDGHLQPSVSLVDAFVINLQLVQVLMYELDAVPRSGSNTLWMMQTVLESAAPQALPHLPDAPLIAQARLTGKRLQSLRGGTWRSVEIEAGLADISLRCAFAHELPAEAAARAAS